MSMIYSLRTCGEHHMVCPHGCCKTMDKKAAKRAIKARERNIWRREVRSLLSEKEA